MISEVLQGAAVMSEVLNGGVILHDFEGVAHWRL